MKKIFLVMISLVLIAGAVSFYFVQNGVDKSNYLKPVVLSETKTPDRNIQPSKSSNAKENGIFTPADAKVLNIELEMKKEEVEKILGKPLEIKKEYDDVTYSDQLQYYYSFGVVKLGMADVDLYEVT